MVQNMELQNTSQQVKDANYTKLVLFKAKKWMLFQYFGIFKEPFKENNIPIHGVRAVANYPITEW